VAVPWSGVSARFVIVALLVALVVGALAAAMTWDTGPDEAQTARYEEVRRDCTALAELNGLVGGQRVKAINQCMVDRY
jgi:hypothetical protein